MTYRFILLYFLSTFGLLAQVWAPKEKDTVVLLGDAFFERDYNYGHLEKALTTATAGKNIRFRNLGWSGDTPRCESRSYFGPPAEGFQRLRNQLIEIKPTTVIVCYGAVDAFEGQAGLASFLSSYENMIRMIRESTTASLILLSPPAVSRDAKRWPSLAKHHDSIDLYTKAIQELATKQQCSFADLFAQTKDHDWQTVNGVTFTDNDYKSLAPLFVKSLGLTPSNTDHASLKDLILAKNRLFFQRWRPQNEIYLFGSRKHEQGNNGIEIPQYDPMIAEKEQLIFGTFASH